MAKETKIIEITNPSQELVSALHFCKSAEDLLEKSRNWVIEAIERFISQNDEEAHKGILQARLFARHALIDLAHINGDKEFDESFYEDVKDDEDEDDEEPLPEDVKKFSVPLFKVLGLIECAMDATFSKDTERRTQKVTQARDLLNELLVTVPEPEPTDKEA